MPDTPDNDAAQEARPVSVLSEVTLDLSVEIGRTTLPMRDVLRICPGKVISLDHPSGSPADLYVNGTLFARGQVVEVADSGEYAIRITELVSGSG